MALQSMRGYENVDQFMFGRLCKWRSGADFVFSGMQREANGAVNFRTDADGLDEIDVTVDGCTFQMGFGEKNGKFLASDNKRKCDAPATKSSGSSHGGVMAINKMSSGFGIACNDGSSGSMGLLNNVICGSLLGQPGVCKHQDTTSFDLIAEEICR